MPKITLLQYFILSKLIKKDQNVETLRKKIKYDKTKVAFYMVMKKMELDKLIEGRFEKVVSGDYKVRIRYYSITKIGIRNYNQFRNFVMSK